MFKSKSIQKKIILWFLIIGIIPLAFSIFIPTIREINSSDEKSFQKIISLRNQAKEQIQEWLNEKETQLSDLSREEEFLMIPELINDNLSVSQTRNVYNNIKDLFSDLIEENDDLNEVFIVDALNGEIIISSNTELLGEDKSEDIYFTEPLKNRKLFISDSFFRGESQEKLLSLSVPLFNLNAINNNLEIVGILVTFMNPEIIFNEIYRDIFPIEETGEVVLVNKYFEKIQFLKSQENNFPTQIINSESIARALNKETGFIKTNDYKNIPVYASYTFIEDLGWGLIVKQDKKEIKGQILLILFRQLALFFIFLALLIVITFFISKSISETIASILNVSENKDGETTNSENKKSINDLVYETQQYIDLTEETIDAKFEILERVSEISNTMMGPSDIKEFSKNLLKKLMEITGSNMGVFYILNKTKDQYVHLVSVGANKKMLIPFNAKNPEGEFGQIINSRKLGHIKNIPEDTIFKFKTSIGEVIPKEVITLPIIVENEVLAAISLVKLYPFNKNSIEILEQSSVNINTAYSNILATEKTRQLAEHLSVVNEQLEIQTKELINKSEELQRYTLELNKQNKELEFQRTQVEEANRLKSEFVSNMSHELRTPLNSILALSGVLSLNSNSQLSEEQLEYLEIIERNGKQLLTLINHILDLSKIEAGKINVTTKEISVKTLLQTIIENLKPLVDAKSLSMDLHVPEDIPFIKTDENQLSQVLQNVIGNAIKFTDKGFVKITASYENKDQKIVVTVKDTGIGIPESDLPYIFEEFRQVDGTTSRKFEGTGLGLAIAKKTIKILGGDIFVTSKIGVGSEFIIEFPLKTVLEEKPKQVTYFKPGIKKGSSKNILIVDDDLEIVHEIEGYLKETGYETISATSGQEALEMAEKYQPALITLDIIMPEMDGWEVLQELKKNPKTKRIPVLVASVSDDLKIGLALGAVGHLKKPLDKEKFLYRIDSIFRTFNSLLLVDDNDVDLQLMSYKLKSEKWKVNTASGGKECLNLIDENVPDVLILDLLMPEVDGFQVLEQIRTQDKTKDLPVIIITSKNLTQSERNNLEGKVSKILIKSQTSLHDLHAEINKILSVNGKSPEPEITNSSETLLFIGDNEDKNNQIESLLHNSGFNVIRISKVSEFSNRKRIPDIILFNPGSKDSNGITELKKINEHVVLKEIPVLILSENKIYNGDLNDMDLIYLYHSLESGKESLLSKLRNLLDKATEIIEDETLFVSDYEKETQGELKKKVLIIEDNEDSRIAMRAILKDDYEILEAIDGLEGLKISQTWFPDLILLDISLPFMDGLEVARILKNHENTKQIPIIAVTAHAMKHDRDICIKSGCNEFISKPVDAVQLKNMVESFLK